MGRTFLCRPRRPFMAAVVATGLLGALAGPVETGPAPMGTTAAEANTATVFYYTKTKNWTSVHLHYAPDGGAWTTAPGTKMEAACTDWVKQTVDLGSAAGLAATFNNGGGTWDNNGGANYALGAGNITVKDGVIAHSDPCAGTEPAEGNRATVYYSTATTGWTTANLHYAPTGGTWTTAPGVGMEAACTGWWKKTLDIGTATSLKAAFNRLNRIRRAVPALQTGQYSTEGISGSMAFKRRYTSGSTDSFALVTVTGAATYTDIPNGTYKDAVTGDVKTVSNGMLSVAAPGKGNLRVYVLNGPGKIGADGPYLK